jgi:hypothetical protein
MGPTSADQLDDALADRPQPQGAFRQCRVFLDHSHDVAFGGVCREPQKDVRSQVAGRMAHLTRIPYDDIVACIEAQAKTHFAYAMASPVFRQKPTFLMKKWIRLHPGAKV